MRSYFNTHGGGPGKAPAMAHDFIAKDGRAAFDKLNDPDALYQEKAQTDEEPRQKDGDK